MASRTAEEAVDNFLDRFRELVSCVAPRHLHAATAARPELGRPQTLIVNQSRPFELRGTDLSLRLELQFTCVADDEGDIKVEIVHYVCTLFRGERELIAFHWHPGTEEMSYPHIHAGPALGVGKRLGNHILSGFVGLGDLILWLVQEMGVRPRRDDWAEVLERAMSWRRVVPGRLWVFYKRG